MITFWHVLELFQYRAWNSYETMVLYYLVLTVCVAFVMAMSGKSLVVLTDQKNVCFTYDFSILMFAFHIINQVHL